MAAWRQSPAPSADLIRLIDPVTLQEYATLESPLNAAITALCFSPDGTQLAASTHSRALQLWDYAPHSISARQDEVGLGFAVPHH